MKGICPFCFLLLATSCQSFASDIYVNANSTAEQAIGTRAAPFRSLQTAADAAVSSDRILVAKGRYVGTDPEAVLVLLGKTLDIEGGYTGNFAGRDPTAYPTVIDGEDIRRGLYLVYGQVRLDGVTVKRGSGQWGGGIHVRAGTLYASQCVIRDNSSLGDNDAGGGLFATWNGCAVFLDRCLIENNSAGKGGAVHVVAGARLCMTNCVVTGNRAAFAGGISANNGTAAIEGTIFVDNVATYGAGGIGAGPNSYVVLNNCTVTRNQVTDDYPYSPEWQGGGGVQVAGSSSSASLMLTNSIVYGNTAPRGNDLFCGEKSVVQANHCNIGEISGNLSSSNHLIRSDPLFLDQEGGDLRLNTNSPCIDAGTNALWMLAGTDLDGLPRIVNGTVDFGAYEFNPSSLTFTVFANPEPHGIAAPYGYGTFRLSRPTITSNTVPTPTHETDGVRYWCTGWIGTGSIPPAGNTNAVTVTIAENSSLTWQWAGPRYLLTTSAQGPGSVMADDGWHEPGTHVPLMATPLTNCVFVRWSGDVPSGYETHNPLTVVMTQPRALTAHFSDLYSVHYVDAHCAAPQYPYGTWETAATNIQAAVNVTVEGDLVLVAEATYTLSNELLISKNISVRSTGGPMTTILEAGSSNRCVKMTVAGAVLEGFTIRNGFTTGDGGGVHLTGGTLTNCIIQNNTSADRGGGVYSLGGRVLDCRVLNNLGLVGPNGRGYYSAGGGVYSSTGGLVAHCTIRSNISDDGGGVSMDGGIMLNSLIADNEARVSGGGVIGDTLTVDRCHISANVSGWVGGGLDLDAGIVERCVVALNHSGRGGGIRIYGTVRNTILTDNIAEMEGGGISIAKGAIENCTILGNVSFGDGGGILVDGDDDKSILSTIASFNYAAIDGDNFFSDGISEDETLVVSNCYFGGNPLLVNIAAADYHLMPESPCIDAGGFIDTVQSDLDGIPRPLDGDNDGIALPDIGAFEYLHPMADSDNDDLTDASEIAAGTNPTLYDTDGDTLGDGDEIVADTDPLDADSVLAIIAIYQTPWGPSIHWKGGRDAWQLLEVTPALNNTEGWTPILAVPPPTPLTNAVIHVVPANATMFYRITVPR